MVFEGTDFIEREARDSRGLDRSLLTAEGPVRVVFSFKLTLVCEGCRAPMPVHQLGGLEVTCPSCGEGSQLGGKTWRRVFDDDTVATACSRQRGATIEREDRTGRLHGTCGRSRIRCEHCESEAPDELVDRWIDDGAGACPGCGEDVSVRGADKGVRRIVPGAVAVVGEGRNDPDGSGRTESMNCPGCGANLDLDGSSRLLKCGYCGASLTVPDPLWLRLHPLARPRELYVVADIEEGRRWSWLLRPAGRAEQVLQIRGELPDTALDGLAASGSPRARLRAAKHPAATARQLATLAGDRHESEVRAAVARHRNIDRDTAGRLLDDHAKPVQRAALDNPAWSLSDLEEFIAGGDYLLHHVVAERPDIGELSDATFHTLLDRAEGGFLERIEANPALPVARLWAIRRERPADDALLVLIRRGAELPEGALTELARHEEPAVRHAVAGSPATPNEALRLLAKDGESPIAEAARNHPDYQPSIWNRLGF